MNGLSHIGPITMAARIYHGLRKFRMNVAIQTVILESFAVFAIVVLLFGLFADLNREPLLESHRANAGGMAVNSFAVDPM